jgi:integrase/recombinase XerD
VNFNKWHKTILKLPFLPTSEEIQNLIGGFKNKKAAFLTLLMETGFRSGEAWRLRWTDVDFERGIVTMNTPEKGSLPRQQKISGKLCSMLNMLPKTSDRIWNGDRKALYYFRIGYINRRNRIAASLINPRIKQIKMHTLRHYYASMEYHKTKNIVHVQEKLGHKSILNTMIYTHLVDFSEDEYDSTIAKTQSEKLELLSKGWEFICQDTVDGMMYFRRRK